MKRIDNLFAKICSVENLCEAERKARRGKTKSYGVRLFDKNRDGNIEVLSKMLIEGRYKTSEYSTFTITDPKERMIFRLPYYPDRIVHHAVMNVLEPIWVKLFVKNTYSCIKGRGIHKAVNDVKRDLKNDIHGTRYCLKIDIRKYYPSIDHDVLKSIIRRKIKDIRLLRLLDEIIDSADGVPIGNYLSQYFANLYLTYFDHWMKETKGVRYYYRYADDIVVLHHDKEYLHSLLRDIQNYLYSELHIEVKDNWQVFPVEDRGVDFLGYVFRHTYTRLRKRIKQNLFRKVIRQSKRLHDTRSRSMAIASYFGWLKYCNSHQLKVKLNTYYNEEIFL